MLVKVFFPCVSVYYQQVWGSLIAVLHSSHAQAHCHLMWGLKVKTVVSIDYTNDVTRTVSHHGCTLLFQVTIV